MILHSPLVRARQTAETIAGEVGQGVIVMEERLLSPGVQTASLLRRLSDSGAKRIVCVGHQPDMSRCLAEMLGGGRHLYSPGTIAGIEFGVSNHELDEIQINQKILAEVGARVR